MLTWFPQWSRHAERRARRVTQVPQPAGAGGRVQVHPNLRRTTHGAPLPSQRTPVQPVERRSGQPTAAAAPTVRQVERDELRSNSRPSHPIDAPAATSPFSLQPKHGTRSVCGSTPFHQCVLGPGELLYIPRHAWHYVRSLQTSFSVSFWWGAKMGLRTRADGSVEPVY